MNNKILALLAEIETVCNAWNETKEAHANRAGWMFSYKLYDLAYACEDNDVFYMADEMAPIVTGKQIGRAHV